MRSWLWSKIEKRLPRIVDSTQVNHAVVGQDKPWYFSERRFLVFGKRGPWELVIKPSHVGACAMFFTGSIFALGYFSVQTLNTAFTVANQELISPADASLITSHNSSAELDRIEENILGIQIVPKLGPRRKEQSISNHLFAMKVRDIRNAARLNNLAEQDDDWHQQPLEAASDGMDLSKKLNEITKLREQMLSSFDIKNSNLEEEEIQIIFDLPKFEKNFSLVPDQNKNINVQPSGQMQAGIAPQSSLVNKMQIDDQRMTPPSHLAQDQDNRNVIKEAEKQFAGALTDMVKGIDETIILPESDTISTIAANLSLPNDIPLIMNETVRGARFLKSIDRELRVIEHVFEQLGIELQKPKSSELSRVNLNWPMEPGSSEYLEYMRQQFVELDIYRDALASLPLHSPMKYYYISSKYGKRKHPVTKNWAMHHGIDLAGTWQEKVRATADGTVVFSGWEGSFGRVVRVQHRFGIQTVYAHLSRLNVEKGDYVSSGDVVGSMGSSGRSEGAHLHYEIRVNKESKNPKNFFDVGQSLLSPNSLRLTAYQ
ncbi:M23 family metallopeptidase [bacterium]|nr:M23 family metallopeptidase [bacterium]